MRTIRLLPVLAAAIAALSVPPAALAVAPVVTSVSQQNRHPAIVFSAPHADGITVFIASNPARATDGAFLSENVKGFDPLTDSEIQAGRWLDADQLDPGQYWLMIRADANFNACWHNGGLDPACADGYSEPVPLTIPRPAVRYSASVTRYTYLHEASLTLKATPLGERQPYKLCYTLKTRKRRCLNGTIDGYSWNSSADDSLTVKTTGLAAVATFTWYVNGRAVVSKRARVR